MKNIVGSTLSLESVRQAGYHWAKMDIAVSQVFASFTPCFYARSIIRMALRRLTEKKHSCSNELF